MTRSLRLTRYHPLRPDQRKDEGASLCWNLYTLNALACIAHGIMAGVVLGIAIWRGQDKRVPVTISYSSGVPGPYHNTSSSFLVDPPGISYAFLAFAFEVICFFAHARVLAFYDKKVAAETLSWFGITNAENYATYKEDILLNQENVWRWNEYALSSSVMILAVASATGSHSLGELFGYAAANIGCMYCGYWSETLNKTGDKGHWLPFIIGSIQEIFIWIPIIVSYAVTVVKSPADPPVPIIVHFFIAQLFIAFNLFAAVEALWISDVVKSYKQKETWYVVLSFASKMSLSGLIIGSTFSS
jgi:hypothetical protein